MRSYRLIALLYTVVGCILALGAIAFAVFKDVSIHLGLAAVTGVSMLLAFIMPDLRRRARNILATGICPWCGEPRLREYPDQHERWYCRACATTWTIRGKRIRAKDYE